MKIKRIAKRLWRIEPFGPWWFALVWFGDWFHVSFGPGYLTVATRPNYHISWSPNGTPWAAWWEVVRFGGRWHLRHGDPSLARHYEDKE